jgi:hypothetical protein
LHNWPAVLAQLKESARRIELATRGLSAAALRWKPSAESWSVNEVIAHLRACADVWGGSIARMLKEDNPTIRYVSPRGWIRKTDYLELNFEESFAAFRKQREALLLTLQPLDEKGWKRRAQVKAAKLREETVLSYAERLAQHETGHCVQIERILEAWRDREA